MAAAKTRIAIVWHGDAEARAAATLAGSRFEALGNAIEALGGHAEAVIYHDDGAEQVETKLRTFDGVLVWVNPIAGDDDRTVLDGVLRRVAEAGVGVSTHPDVILKIGTKQVLFDTRTMPWGTDVHVFESVEAMLAGLPSLLEAGPQVLKQYRGHSGGGIWKAEALPTGGYTVRHAQRGSPEQKVTLQEIGEICAPYFAASGKMIVQPYQNRIAEGMVRCYMVEDTIEGFGHQAENALVPIPEGSSEVPLPGPRLYSGKDDPWFQRLRRLMEEDWLPELMQRFGLEKHTLPLLWDADFMFGPKQADGQDTYVLCEINVSCVTPYPDSATEPLAAAALRRFSVDRA